MPGLEVLWIDLSGLFTVIYNLLIVAILKLLNILVGLDVLELPEAKLVMADAQKLRFDVLWLLEQVHQNMLRFVEGILVAVRAALIVERFRDGDLDSGEIVDQLLVLLLDGVDALASLHALLIQKLILALIQLFFQLQKDFLAQL